MLMRWSKRPQAAPLSFQSRVWHGVSCSDQMALSEAYWGNSEAWAAKNVVSVNFSSSSLAASPLLSVLAAALTGLEQPSARAQAIEIVTRSEGWLFNPSQQMNLKLEKMQNTKIMVIPFLLTGWASLLLLFLPALYFMATFSFRIKCFLSVL